MNYSSLDQTVTRLNIPQHGKILYKTKMCLQSWQHHTIKGSLVRLCHWHCNFSTSRPRMRMEWAQHGGDNEALTQSKSIQTKGHLQNWLYTKLAAAITCYWYFWAFQALRDELKMNFTECLRSMDHSEIRWVCSLAHCHHLCKTTGLRDTQVAYKSIWLTTSNTLPPFSKLMATLCATIIMGKNDGSVMVPHQSFWDLHAPHSSMPNPKGHDDTKVHCGLTTCGKAHALSHYAKVRLVHMMSQEDSIVQLHFFGFSFVLVYLLKIIFKFV